MVVKTEQVVSNIEREPSQYFIRKMMDVLKRQGQIQPLQVRRSQHNEYIYQTFKQDVFAAETIMAARQLGWPTILIAVVDRFEE